MNRRTEPIVKALKVIIKTGTTGTQEEICERLTEQGFNVNQSKISRLLRKIAVVKTKNERGKIVYQLPKEPAPPPAQSPLANLILDITANETLIVIVTSPGSASLIARMLDYQPSSSSILATIAGDDTIFVAPKSVHKMDETKQEIQHLLSHLGTQPK